MFDLVMIACYAFIVVAVFAKVMQGAAAGMKETDPNGPR